MQELYGIEPVVLDLSRFVQREAQMILLAGLELRRRFRRKGFLLDRQGNIGAGLMAVAERPAQPRMVILSHARRTQKRRLAPYSVPIDCVGIMAFL
jgi:hypothetical protein